MNTIIRYATAAALTGALALAAATPSEARNGRNAAAIGFGVGAVAGAAIAGSAYSNGYYGEPGYAYGYAPGYAYDSIRVRAGTCLRLRLHLCARLQQPLWLRQLLAGSAQDQQLLDQLAALAECGLRREAALRSGFFLFARVAPACRARLAG